MIRVGQKLQEARLQRKLTLEQVSKATKIKEQFLAALEKGEYCRLPSRTYAYGFVKNYIDYLGLPKKETLALFRREFNEEQVFKVLPEGLSKLSEFPVRRYRFQRNIFFILTILLLILGYIIFQYRFAFINPPLEIIMPKEGQVITVSVVKVKGKTDRNATVVVDNMPVALESDGSFVKNIDVLKGEMAIEVKAVNRFGRETVVKRNIKIVSETKINN